MEGGHLRFKLKVPLNKMLVNKMQKKTLKFNSTKVQTLKICKQIIENRKYLQN